MKESFIIVIKGLAGSLFSRGNKNLPWIPRRSAAAHHGVRISFAGAIAEETSTRVKLLTMDAAVA